MCAHCFLTRRTPHYEYALRRDAILWYVQTRLWSLDYAGITVLIVSSFIPPIFYGFLCHPVLRNFYLYSTLSLGTLQ